MTNIYLVSKNLLGRRLTLNPTVPPAFGCAQAVSYILDACGYNVGRYGISGTAELYEWLQKNATKVTDPQPGDVLISVTGSGKLKNGHCGTFGVFNFMYDNDFAILSNNSRTGLLDTQWSYKEWLKYYKDFGELLTEIYRLN